MEDKKKAKLDKSLEDLREWRQFQSDNPNPIFKNWRAWGSWFSWGSPVGLGIFIALTLISIGVLVQLTK